MSYGYPNMKGGRAISYIHTHTHTHTYTEVEINEQVISNHSLQKHRERPPQFVVQAYLAGPKNVNFQETGPMWLKFEEALSYYEDIKKYALLLLIRSQHFGERDMTKNPIIT